MTSCLTASYVAGQPIPLLLPGLRPAMHYERHDAELRLQAAPRPSYSLAREPRLAVLERQVKWRDWARPSKEELVLHPLLCASEQGRARDLDPLLAGRSGPL